MPKPPTSKPDAPSIELWLVDSRRVHADELDRLQAQLSADESRQFARFVRAQRQRQYLLGRIMLRLAVGRMLDLPPAMVSTMERIGFSPSLVLPAGCEHPHFSLSHSGHWIACAISRDSALGLDIELLDPTRDLDGISATAFQPDECAWLRNRPDHERVAAFYRLWTLKEARFKLMSNLGKADDATPLADSRGELASSGNGWHARPATHADIAIAICGMQPVPDITLIDASDRMRVA